MMDFRERYKRVGISRGDMAANRAIRSQRCDEIRHNARTDNFSLRRDIQEDISCDEDESVPQEESESRYKNIHQGKESQKKTGEDLEDVIQKRLLELEKWKEERKRRRLLEKKQAKPAFKVGVVHHKVYSPPITKDPIPHPTARLCKSKEISHSESPPKRVTRATVKRLASKALNSKLNLNDLRMKRKAKAKVLSKVKDQKKEQVPLVSDDFQFKAPMGVTAIPMFGRQALDTTKKKGSSESSSDVSSSISDFGKNLSSGRDSVFDAKNQSIILSKSASVLSNLNTPKLNLCDSSITKSLNNSMNESSVEAITLKLSMDDEEILDDQDCLSTNKPENRRSTRTVSKEIRNEKNSSLKLADQEMIEDQENINYNIKNLIDYSISDLSTISSLKRKKSMYFDENLQNQSLMKFSPRRSTRHQTVNSVNEGITMKAPSTESTHAILNQSMTELSTPKNDIFSHTYSEPKIVIEKNEYLNHSLNISLPKDSTPDKPPAFFSPYVVTSRGKDRARKEVQHRRFSRLSPEEIPTKENIMQKLNISVEEEERTSQYYKFLLNKEIDRLNKMCDTWNIIKQDSTTPEDIHYEIQAAVGHTQLLINKKFERFRGLVLDCETGKGEMLVTCKDLQGFWEMMYMEIMDCDNRFNKLEIKKAKNWVEEGTEEEKKEKIPKKKPAASKKPAPKKKPVAAKSSIRAHIMAARKKMEDKDSEMDIEMRGAPAMKQKYKPQEDVKVPKNDDTPSRNTRRISSTPKSTKKSQLLLKQVQLSQTRKPATSPLIVMKLGQMCKTPEVQLDDSIIYVNSDRTPAKSILKSSKEELGSVAKSANKVFFKEQPTEFREFEKKIQSNDEEIPDNMEISKGPIERRLDFENTSFDSSDLKDEDEKDKEQVDKSTDSLTTLSPFDKPAEDKFTKIPKLVVHQASPTISLSPLNLQDKKEKSSIKKKARVKKTISFQYDSIENSTRSLRTRKLSAPGTPRLKSRNFEDTNEDLSMEVDYDSPIRTQQVLSKQWYMNEEGIICERIESVTADTPRTRILRRTNSDAIRKSKRYSSVKDSEAKTPNTPITRQRKFSEIVMDSPTISENENKTPQSTKKNTKKGKALTSSDLEKTVIIQPTLENNKFEVTTPKLRKHQLKKSQDNVELNEVTDKDVNKRYLDSVDNSEQKIDENSTNEVLTPTITTRRSLRIIHRSMQEKRNFEDVK